MTNRIFSIILGLIIVAGTGSLVYVKKQPVVVTPQNTDNSVLNNTTNNQNNNQNPVSTKRSYEEEEEDEDEGGVAATPQNTTPAPTQTTGATTQGITLSQVAAHKSRTSCWSAINGNVYDLTSWIPNHPGGEQAILSLCGIDGSAAYNGQHGGSTKAANILFGFKIGTLK
jgi:cytochrome b involved in lipid metabolism